MSAPFLSPRGEGSRCTICTACSDSARVADSCLPQFAYANLVTISPRSFSASNTAATSNSRCSVDLTPISMLSKSMNTAILNFSSISCLLILSIMKLILGRHAQTNEYHNFLQGSPWLKYRRDALPLEIRGVFVRNDAADDHFHV